MDRISLAEAQAALEAEEAQKRADARRLVLEATGDVAPRHVDKVPVRVLKMGHDKISMGTHVPRLGDAYYARGDRFHAERPIAEALEARGFVEIEEPIAEPAEPEPELAAVPQLKPLKAV